jgi:formylmethanofuran--tetrahydromethanopterin N-formyltransferase
LELNGVEIEDTYAEAFPIKVARVLITAATKHWAQVAAQEATGFGTSVIMCPAEAGIEKFVSGDETPDGRPGVYIQICTFGYKSLEQQVLERVGQCILTAPTTAVFNGLPDAEKQFDTGFKLKFFADGTETETEIAGRKMHRIPMMEGDFLVENSIGAVDGVAGGNFFMLADSQMSGLANKYTFLKATANEKFCPSIKDQIEGTEIPADVNAVYEIVINGISVDAVGKATAAGIKAAVTIPGVKSITAGNYGGTLGPHKFNLHDLL